MKIENIPGKPGFVFSIDATMAGFLMILMLAVAAFLSAQADESPYSSLQIARAGNDALAMMAASKVLYSNNSTIIGEAINSTNSTDSMLPKSLGAHLEISTYYYDSGNFIHANTTPFGESVPANATSVYLARRDFVSSKNGMAATYSIARMLVWQK